MKINKVTERKEGSRATCLNVEVEGEEEIYVYADPEYWKKKVDGEERFIKDIRDHIKNRAVRKKEREKKQKEIEVKEVEIAKFKNLEVDDEI